MSAETGIQWTDATWNPVRGCSRVSPGCENCYAETMAARFVKPGQAFHGFALQRPARWTRKVELVPSMLDLPLRWKKPRRIFVNSMSDLFHESLSNEAIDYVFGVMSLAPQHTFQVLTKRAARMAEYMTTDRLGYIEGRAKRIARERGTPVPVGKTLTAWPFPNVWLGVSVEDQQRADERIPHLLRTPAAVRFLSVEPLLGPVNLRYLAQWDDFHIDCLDTPDPAFRVDWVIVGGESGPGARPMRLDWARSIVEQCKAAGVACFVKQLGGAHDKRDDPAEWPTDLRVREFPP